MAEKPEFTTVSFDSLNLRRAIEVSPSLYIEGNRSASEIGRAIGQLLDICNVDYNNVVIRYTSIDAESTPSSSEIASSRKTVENDVAADEKTVDVSELDNEIYEVIKAKYLNGFLVGAINFKKMRRFYEEIYAKELEIENEGIEESLKKTCVLLDNKYYAIDSLVQDELKFKIAEFIQQEIQNELLQVQKEITELPAGYISKKNINGKTRYYLQWTENGKKKSKYVDDAIGVIFGCFFNGNHFENRVVKYFDILTVQSIVHCFDERHYKDLRNFRL